MLHKLFVWIKKEIVFSVIFLLTLASLFIVPPSLAYGDYIDWNTIFILFSLMAVLAGFAECGIFTKLGEKLCATASGETSLKAALVFLCFFSSMLITNDVALLTFVPFAVTLLGTSDQKSLIQVLVLQTIAANTGSMLTPIGNPQNLFLFSQMGLSLGEFLLTMLPLTLASGILLVLALIPFPSRPALHPKNTPLDVARHNIQTNREKTPVVKTLGFLALFILSLLAVLHLIPSWVVALVVVLFTLILNPKVLIGVDYMLLLTFICFFIFTGNVAAIPSVSEFLQHHIAGKEFAAGILVSQVISNVPATLMLFPFSQNSHHLLLGVNLGGLGTVVGSLASLITLKLYLKTENSKAGSFLAQFTWLNLSFLVFLVAVQLVMERFS